MSWGEEREDATTALTTEEEARGEEEESLKMSTRPTTTTATTTKARETTTVAPKSELSDYFGHYVVASKGTNRNSGNARFSSMSSMSSKNCLGRKQIFAAHRDDKAKDVLICEGEQTRNRGSYTFYSPKNLPKLFASVGGTLRAATREELKAWLQKMNLEGAVVENEEDQSRCVRKQQQNRSNGGYHYHQQLDSACAKMPRARVGIPPRGISSNLAYSSTVFTVKESHEKRMAEKRLKQRKEIEREAEEEAKRQKQQQLRKKPKTKPSFVSIKYPSSTAKKQRGSKDVENEDFGHHEDPFFRTIAGDESDDGGENNNGNNKSNNNKVIQFKTGGEVGVGVGGGDLPCISNDDTTADGDGGAFPENFSYDADIMNILPLLDEHELTLPLSKRRFLSYEEINAPSIASKKDMEENPFHLRSGFYLRSNVLNERGIFAVNKERKEKSNGHYNYNVSNELRGLCKSSWKPPSFKNAADAKAWLDEVLKTTPLNNKELKDLEEAQEQDMDTCMTPISATNTNTNDYGNNICKTSTRNTTIATATNRITEKEKAKFGGGVAENQRQNLQASVTWTTQRADASTVEALRDIARGIVMRLNSNTLPPERAISALDALKDVDMSLELLELSPIASAVSAIAEDGCSMTNEARQAARELLQDWKEAAQRGVLALEDRVEASKQYYEKSGLKKSSD